MYGKKILLIDDDADFLRMVSLVFNDSGAQTMTACDGLEGMAMLFTKQPDLIVLDIMMPGVDGFEICIRIRQFSDIPVIMLSALDHDRLMVRGLEAGADDFLSKPINPEILLARARAVIRRSKQENNDIYKITCDDGRIEIDFEKHKVLVDRNEIRLTPVEFRLLTYLATNAGKVLPFQQLLFRVWGSEYEGNDDYVHVYVSNLRRKIERDSKNPVIIRSVYGVGYLFEKQESGQESSAL